MRPRARRRLVWLLLLVCAVLSPLWTWPLRHVELLDNAWTYRRAPKVMAVPVEGLAVSQLVSTWHAPRSGGRKHEGADLFAKRGTPVVSAVTGDVWRIGNDRLGGQVVWVLGEGHTLYYYAHLDHFAEGLVEGQHVTRGQTLGFVGNTGNARTTPPHLHFGMYRIGWTGLRAEDPVPRLKRRARTSPHHQQPHQLEPVLRRDDVRPVMVASALPYEFPCVGDGFAGPSVFSCGLP